MNYVAGYAMEKPVIYKSLKKEYSDGTVWTFFIEGDGYVQISLYALTGSGDYFSRTYTFKEHRYLIYQVPAVLKRAGWLWTAISTLDSIAEKYK